MTTDNLFVIIMFIGVYICCLLLLDTAHRAHIAELKHIHREQVASLRSYIRTLSRERLWLEAELQRHKDKLAEREQVQGTDTRWMPEHIQWLPPSEEFGEGD
jgi:signal transduction histidine kinase